MEYNKKEKMEVLTQNHVLTQLMAFEVTSEGDNEIFWHKLRSENNWSQKYCAEMFKEYKKFLYLILVSDRTLCPSKNIDVVWHTHMMFTKSYWIDLCRNLLGREIHHMPSSHSKISKEQDQENYRYTLELYQSVFKENPPTSGWAIQPKKNSKVKNLAFIGLTSLLLTACTNTKVYGIPLELIGFGAFVLICCVVGSRYGSDKKGGGGCGG